MKWKEELEKKIKQDIYIDSFNGDAEKVMDYIYNYFESFFNVERGSDYIELERSDERITFKVYNRQVDVKKGNPSIQFKYYNATDRFMDSFGQLYVPEMRFTHSGGTKVELFSDDLLNRYLENAFKELVKSGVNVVPKPF